ncbi:unnamed protein product [Lampetra fluviatilis]
MSDGGAEGSFAAGSARSGSQLTSVVRGSDTVGSKTDPSERSSRTCVAPAAAAPFTARGSSEMAGSEPAFAALSKMAASCRTGDSAHVMAGVPFAGTFLQPRSFSSISELLWLGGCVQEKHNSGKEEEGGPSSPGASSFRRSSFMARSDVPHQRLPGEHGAESRSAGDLSCRLPLALVGLQPY